ncbi:MAG TPA: PIN domain-containing protein [Thermoanaerobaculia bacterium]|nr:PIN domain-containing protein [Thermoanaerobaculia bacterium]
MRVLVDTSAWAEFLNGTASPEARAVDRLLAGEDDVCTCGLVVAEVFQGIRRDREEVEAFFRKMTFLEPSGIDVYLKAADVHRTLRRRGVTIRSTIDCFLAVLAAENGCALLFRDRDLDRIVASGLLDLPARA